MIAGIVLAAGMSTRMGAFKQLLPLEGKTVIERVVSKLTGRLAQVLVVVGHRAAEVQRVLAGYAVTCVFNPDYASGMLSSVQCGVRAAAEASAYLICLGDQPGVGNASIETLLAAAAATDKGIVVLAHRGRWGHPILIRSAYRQELLSLPVGRGLNAVTRGHPEDTLVVPVADEGILRDMDFPADYQREWEKAKQTR